MSADTGTHAPRPRRIELLAALSTAIDLGLGQPMEHMLRSALIADELAHRLGLTRQQRETTFYTSLVTWIGCHGESHEYAAVFGDDIDAHAAHYDVEWVGLPYLRFLVHRVGRDRSLRRRSALLADLVARGELVRIIRSHCTSAGLLATEVGLPEEVSSVLQHTFERWDGRGGPAGLRGEEVAVEMRVVQLADVAEVWLRTRGVSACLDMVRSRRGTQFDPAVADAFSAGGDRWARLLGVEDVWSAALERAPQDDHALTDVELDRAIEVLGDFADLKCPFTLGHSRGVAELAAQSARAMGMSVEDCAVLRRAGLLHDLGRIGVPSTVWEKPGRLSGAEWERVRLHPYLTERVLRRVPGLESEARIAVAHHERQDGSGYPHGLRGGELGTGQRLLAATDCFHTSLEERPHRPASDEGGAVRHLQHEARSGRLDPVAVEAVLSVTGRRSRRRDLWPDGLTTREVEVLRLVARAESNREIAERLVLSEKTVRNHVEHVYAKIGVTNRVGASMYAVRAGLAENFPHPRGPIDPLGSESGASAP